MLRRSLPLLVLLAAGCVPVTEPVGDITKAEPDKALVGNWDDSRFIVDVPEVKGNPKGLMRAISGTSGPSDNDVWFFTTTIGEHTYANMILTPKGGLAPQFQKEGEFAKWQKEPKKRYCIVKYNIDDKRLAIDCGSVPSVRELMMDKKIKSAGTWYETPAGWLAEYLNKPGPDKIFNGTKETRYYRTIKE